MLVGLPGREFVGRMEVPSTVDPLLSGRIAPAKTHRTKVRSLNNHIHCASLVITIVTLIWC